MSKILNVKQLKQKVVDSDSEKYTLIKMKLKKIKSHNFCKIIIY